MPNAPMSKTKTAAAAETRPVFGQMSEDGAAQPPAPEGTAALLQAIRLVVAAAVQIVRNAAEDAKAFKCRANDCLLNFEVRRLCLMIESIAEETERRLDRFVLPHCTGAEVPPPGYMNLFALSGFFQAASSAHGSLQRLHRAAAIAAQRLPALTATDTAALEDVTAKAAALGESAAAAATAA